MVGRGDPQPYSGDVGGLSLGPQVSVTPSPENASREEGAEVKLWGSGSGEGARSPVRWGVGSILGIFRHVYT